MELDGARTEVLFAKDGTLNLTQLFRLPESSAQNEDSDSEPFPLRIDNLHLREKALHFQDLRPSEPVEFAYDALDVELHNLSTLAGDNAEMTLTARGPNGGHIDWQGQISLTPLTSSGSLKLTDGRLRAIWPYVRDAVPLALKEGLLDLSSDYRLDLSKGTDLQLITLRPRTTMVVDGISFPDPGHPVRIDRRRRQRQEVAPSQHSTLNSQPIYGSTSNWNDRNEGAMRPVRGH